MRIILVSVCLMRLVGAESPALNSLLGLPAMKPASVGFFMVPLVDEEITLEWRADKALIPASTMKAVTTATALQILGPEYCFETRLYRKEGDLVVKGGGDPTLGATGVEGAFSTWLTAMKTLGVTEIGDLLVDPTRFEEQRASNDWPTGDVGNYYGAGPSGANYHLNSFALTFKTGKVGEPAGICGISPKPPGVEFVNHMRTGARSSGDQGYVYGGPQAKLLTLRGTVPARGEIHNQGSVAGSSFDAGYGFEELSRGEGDLGNGRGEG